MADKDFSKGIKKAQKRVDIMEKLNASIKKLGGNTIVAPKDQQYS